MTGKRKNDRSAEAVISFKIVGPVHEQGRVIRRADALNPLGRSIAEKDQRREEQLLLYAKMTEYFGRYNEARGYHARRPKGSTRYAEADAAAREWLSAESAQTGEKRPNTLVRLYLEAHPDHPGTSRESTHKRLYRQWTKSHRT